MSKELEALENIKREAGIPCFSTLYDIDMWREDFKTVETALKTLQVIKKELMLEVKEDDGLYRLITYQSNNHLIRKDQYDLLKEVLK